MSKFKSYKEFNGYSTAFRQHRADSHCRFIHGYALKFKVWFESKDDPMLHRFEMLARDRMIQLRVMDDVGCEKFAEFVFNYLNEKITKETNGRVNVHKVQCWEHNENMAEYHGE